MFRIAFQISLIILTANLQSCVSVHPPIAVDSNTFAQKSVVIVVPGYYGTALADSKTGERLHITFGKALFGSTPLALNIESLDIPNAVPTRPDGVLERMTFFPGIYSIDMSGVLVDFLTDAFPETKVVAFA